MDENVSKEFELFFKYNIEGEVENNDLEEAGE